MSDILEARPKLAGPQSILAANGFDNTIRWPRGQRLYDLFERRCERLRDAGRGGHPALDVDGALVSYDELHQRSALMAGELYARGFRAADRIALLLDRSVEAYIALLAVVRLEAAYVPLDAKFPADRIAFICEDAGTRAVIAVPAARQLVEGLAIETLDLADLAAAAATRSTEDQPPTVSAALRADDSLAYIVYTSGSTGRPKGVAVDHSSICNFVVVAGEIYDYAESDRVYQGLTLAFDFSVEELWVPLIAGATLVPAPGDVQLVGAALTDFLVARRITALCCVPTLLATLADDVPGLRFLLISGEACPQDLVTRWHRPGRRLINAYGPTEATVTATWTELHPGRRVTIGIPLPTYTIALLGTGPDETVAMGDVGEIAVGGIGVAVGYVNRAALTSEKFIHDFLGLPGNPSERLYRTGDLGRINSDGEVEYLGRIDSQVKLRGYRIELGEIEEVLVEVPGVAQGVVNVWEPEPGLKELVAYYTLFDDASDGIAREEIARILRERLPAYMVPAYLEPVDAIPLMPSQKADRKALPPPKLPRVSLAARDAVEAENVTEALVAECLAEALGVSCVSVDDHFFDEIGLDSLRAARFLAALNADLPAGGASIADVYLEPTVRRLAARIDATAGATPGPRMRAEPSHDAGAFSHALCGTLQAITYMVQYGLYIAGGIAAIEWVVSAATVAELAARSVTVGAAFILLPTAFAIAAKWCLIGRWKAGRVPIWSLAYFRFWLVRHLVETAPVAFLRGSPLFNGYLRLLGGRVGPGALILTKPFPLCTDLISIGADAVLRRQSAVTGYRAENGYMRFGLVEIGRDATIGEGSYVDIETSIGDRAQLGHASALLAGQTIAPGERMHGSPARPCETDFAYFESARTSAIRRFAYGSVQLVLLILGTALVFAGTDVVSWFLAHDLFAGFEMSQWGVVLTVAISLAGFLAAYTAALLIHLAVPRLLRQLLPQGRTFPLYGMRYWLAQTMSALTNSANFHVLFGDSSFVVRYLQLLGMRQPGVKQTGSNFGTALYQDDPFACEVGSGTMVSDGLTLINHELSRGGFRIGETRLGAQSFVGNNVVYPASSRIGDNCLFASKVMVPTSGPVREGVGLLGSPCFEIPRDGAGRQTFDPVPKTELGRAQLRRKDAYNARTMALYLLGQWGAVLLATLAGFAAATVVRDLFAQVALAAFVIATVLVLYFILLERLTLVGGRMQPHDCTIHDPYFWWVERHWKLGETPLKYAFRGTPFRPIILRWLGVQMGARVFDDGSVITEKELTVIGDGVCINANASIQAHSLEDGLFKSDRIRIGRGCSIGPQAYVHYGVTMGDNTMLAADAFLMKGNATEAGSVWVGNPAKAV